MLWTADLPPDVYDLGFSDSGLTFSYAGQWRGAGGFGGVSFDGEPLWQLESVTETRYESDLLDDGDVLLVTQGTAPNTVGRVLRVDADSGDLVWSTEVDHYLSTYGLLDDRLVGFQQGEGLIGIDVSSGDVLWETGFDDERWNLGPSRPVRDIDRASSSAVFFEAVSGSKDGIIGVTADGRIVAEFEVPRQSTVVAVADDYVLVEHPSALSRYSLTGELQWSTPAIVVRAYEQIDGVALVTAADASSMIGVDTETGENLWTTKELSGHNFAESGDEAFFVLDIGESFHNAVAIDAVTGTRLWSNRVTGLGRHAPMVVGRWVIVGVAGSYSVPGRSVADPNQAGVFQAFHAESGEPAWSLGLNGGFETMAEHDGVIYVVSFPNRASS